MSDLPSGNHTLESPLRPLKQRILRAGSWAFIGHFMSLSLRFVGTLILSRIFAPDVFGILAIVTTISVVLSVMTDIGIRPAIIRSGGATSRKLVNTAWTLQVLRGTFVWSLCCLAALSLHLAILFNLLPDNSVYGRAELPALIAVTSFASVIAGFQSMKSTLAARDLDLKTVTLIELASQASSLLFVGFFGYLTRSIWAYVAGGLLYWLIQVGLGHALLKGMRDKFAWDRQSLNELAKFGKWVFLSSSLGTFASSGDKLLLGWLVSPTVLGTYALAQNLAAVPENIFSRIVGAVSMPALSEVMRTQPNRFALLHSKIRWLSDIPVALLSGFLFSSAHEIIALLYDPRYQFAGYILKWLSIGLTFSVRFAFSQSTYLAVGFPQYVTLTTATKLGSLFLLIPTLLGLFGTEGGIIGIGLHLVPTMILVHYLDRKQGLGNIKIDLAIIVAWATGCLLGVGFTKLEATIRLILLAQVK